jgi:hypothetical protein
MRNAVIKSALVIISLFFLLANINAQTKAEIQNIDFNVAGDSLIVTYDLVKAKSNEKFNVVLVVKTNTGKTFDAISLSGDVGNYITGGKGKRIVWNIAKDKVAINDEIYVQVLATPVPPNAVPSAAVVAQPDQTNVQQQQPNKNQEKVFSKGGAIALSAVMPGLGITKLRDGGAYWLIGIATYGLAISGVVMNIASNSNYNKYKDATTASDRDKYYKNAVSLNKTGNVLLFAAAGIWVADIIITAVVPAKLKFGYSLGPTYDPQFQRPLMTFRVRIGK